MSSVLHPAPVWGHRSLVGWLATSNPLYVISAGLFLFGLRLSFGDHESEVDNWALMSGLAGYTLMLAAAALVLVRFAGVWNDVRTVLLLVVLMFLATSVTFDELLVLDPTRGMWFDIGGLLFAVVTTEGVLRGIRLRLPAGFRVPYYLLLGLFFLYPLALVPFLRDPHGEPLMWGLFLFASVAGLIFLTLIPAVRRGPEYVINNGSPWPWPFFPWSLFVFLAFAVCARSFLLCWSFHLVDSRNAEQLVFGRYFLVPFGFALTLILLELGIVARNRTTTALASLVPIGLMVMAGTGYEEDGIAAEFLSVFMARLGGSPLYLTVIAAGVFYLYAWWRGVALATEGLTAAIIGLAFVRPETVSLEQLGPPRLWPLIVASVFQFALGVWQKNGWRVVAGGAGPVGWMGMAGVRGYLAIRATIAGLDYLVIGVALLPIALLVSLAKAGVLSRWNTTQSGEPRSIG